LLLAKWTILLKIIFNATAINERSHLEDWMYLHIFQ